MASNSQGLRLQASILFSTCLLRPQVTCLSTANWLEDFSSYSLLQSANVVGAAVVGMEELQTLAAFAKDQMKKSKSVRLSAVGASEWGHIQKNTGVDQRLHSACFVVPGASQPSQWLRSWCRAFP